jgi:hypothetical protein
LSATRLPVLVSPCTAALRPDLSFFVPTT